ncbi:MAG: hypothetical protein RLZZ623_3148 [Actinomycetota bacterium]|jgi:DNA-binding LacI/PurR family transcriptional regulator
MDDVARLAGVSRALVSLVMRSSPRVSARSRQLVLDAAAQLGYRPNLMARNLAARRTTTIGLVLNDLHNPFFAELADGVLAAADAAGYSVILASARRSAALEARALDTLLASRVDGIVVAGSRLPRARVAKAAESVPMVSIARALRVSGVGSVCTDEAAGAALAIAHLHELGHRRIAHIDGGRGAGSAARRSGYLAAMRASGLGDAACVVGGEYTETAGAHAMHALLRSALPPTAVFAANDLSAIGAIDLIEREHCNVPTDVSMIGFDNTALSGLNHIGLTTVAQPSTAMGRRATEMLVGNLNGDAPLEHVVMAPQLVLRGTTCRPAT